MPGKAKRSLRVAISQHPVSTDVRANGRYIRKFVIQAARQGADILQICEAGLCGYDDASGHNGSGFDWKALCEETAEIRRLAQKHGIWVILGTCHYLNAKEKPTNCLYLISDKGQIVNRYDKSFCTGAAKNATRGDLAMFTAGNRRVTFRLKGFQCGLQICYDGCFPHLYRAYEDDGVEIMFHSFYNAGSKPKTCLREITPAWNRVRAADHEMWVIASNTCGKYSAWPSMIACPDGTCATRLRLHKPGIRVFEINGVQALKNGWLHMGHNRHLYHKGILNNGRPSRHARALDGKSLPVAP